MKNILVPIDFSSASRNASEYAASMALKTKCKVHLLHVYMEPGTGIENAPLSTMVQTQLGITKEAQINKELEFLEKKYSIEISGDAEVGFAGDTIKEIASRQNADLIVLGQKAESKHRMFGETVTKMIRKTKVPLLVVPEQIAYHNLKNLVLAIDFATMPQGSSFAILFDIIKTFDASLRVIHVDAKGADLKSSEISEKLQFGRLLSKANYSYDRIESDDVEQAILKFVQTHPTDLLIMLAHHHSAFERLFSEIHTRSLSFHLQTPLLILKD